MRDLINPGLIRWRLAVQIDTIVENGVGGIRE